MATEHGRAKVTTRLRLAATSATAILALLPGSVAAVVPNDGGAVTNMWIVPINVSAQTAFNPHVRGDLVSYDAGEGVKYYDMFTGADVQIAGAPAGHDGWSNVGDGLIVYARNGYLENGDSVQVYDPALGTPQ